jgi:multiple sugar transport system substrate-binding protein
MLRFSSKTRKFGSLGVFSSISAKSKRLTWRVSYRQHGTGVRQHRTATSAEDRGVVGFVVAFLLAACLAVSSGCNGQSADETTEEETPAAPPSLRVVVIDDQPLSEVIGRQWTARTQGEIELTQMQAEELDTARQILGDVVIYPSELLGTMVARDLIAPLTTETRRDPQLALQDVFDVQRNAETRWGEELYAVSFGSPQLVLWYRSDLFEELKLSVPSTWEEYQQLLPRLARDQLGERAPSQEQPWSAAIEPLAEGWGGKTLLARAATYAKAPSQFSALFDYLTMTPLITGPPFVRALDELVAAAKECPSDSAASDPAAAKQAFLSGQAAIAWSWPSAAKSPDSPEALPEGMRIGFAELPGSPEAYDFGEEQWIDRRAKDPLHVALLGVAGRLGSVTRDARHAREAAEFLVLVSGREWSGQIAPASHATTLFRQSQLEQPQTWVESSIPNDSAKQYAELVAAVQSQPSHMSSIRIPGCHRYLAALDQAVQASLAGTLSSQEALNKAADEWRTITEELGSDSQRDAYTRSLGLEP